MHDCHDLPYDSTTPSSVSAFILAKKGFIPATNHNNRIERALGLHFDYSPEYSSFYLDERDIPQPADEFGHPESRQRSCTLAVGGAPTLSITAGGARSENSDCDFDLEILEPGCAPRDAFGGELEPIIANIKAEFEVVLTDAIHNAISSCLDPEVVDMGLTSYPPDQGHFDVAPTRQPTSALGSLPMMHHMDAAFRVAVGKKVDESQLCRCTVSSASCVGRAGAPYTWNYLSAFSASRINGEGLPVEARTGARDFRRDWAILEGDGFCPAMLSSPAALATQAKYFARPKFSQIRIVEAQHFDILTSVSHAFRR
ncbi:hypothetical protein B0H13DRAFT_2337363 [Mycena leptocephala]|nr:hypothetical protein B0H13DRAFT_2337363 [Mycena leptocephala]